jgi:peptide-methionine (S)-S-oxide reductase
MNTATLLIVLPVLNLIMLIFVLILASCQGTASRQAEAQAPESARQETAASSSTQMEQNAMQEQREEATFGSGCFWCTEAFFEDLNGVQSVVSGYSGGHIKNPGYREVCSGRTGHAEVVRIVFDPAVVSYAELLEVFWATHDPTTLNRQGNDVGTQYRSVIYYHSEEQERIARASKEAAQSSGIWRDPIVTEISPLINWYPAEEYHQDYFANNPEQPYCAYLIRPKMDKFRKEFAERLKP